MAEMGFKLKLKATLKGYIHKLSDYILSTEIPASKTTFALPYQSINSITGHQVGLNFICMKMHKCQFERELDAQNYKKQGGGSRNILNGESSLNTNGPNHLERR